MEQLDRRFKDLKMNVFDFNIFPSPVSIEAPEDLHITVGEDPEDMKINVV